MKALRFVASSRPVSRPFVSRRSSVPYRAASRLRCRREDVAFDVYDLKAQLAEAVASEDYAAAADLRDAISDRLLDVASAVEYANRRFYKAFEASDMIEMQKLWSRGDHVACIHPMSSVIAGYDLVMESWNAVFATIPRGDFGIDLECVKIHANGRMAYVTCIEVVRRGMDTGRIQATNVLELGEEGEWKMVLHHGSPVQ